MNFNRLRDAPPEHSDNWGDASAAPDGDGGSGCSLGDRLDDPRLNSGWTPQSASTSETPDSHFTLEVPTVRWGKPPQPPDAPRLPNFVPPDAVIWSARQKASSAHRSASGGPAPPLSDSACPPLGDWTWKLGDALPTSVYESAELKDLPNIVWSPPASPPRLDVPAPALGPLPPVHWSRAQEADAKPQSDVPNLLLPHFAWSASTPKIELETPSLQIPTLETFTCQAPPTPPGRAPAGQGHAFHLPAAFSADRLLRLFHLSHHPRLPAALLVTVHNNHANPFISLDRVAQAAFTHRGVSAYGLSGTLRLIRSPSTHLQHAHYLLGELIINLHVLLPTGGEQITTQGHTQTTLDAYGRFARDLAASQCFDELLALQEPQSVGHRHLTQFLTILTKDLSGLEFQPQVFRDTFYGLKEALWSKLNRIHEFQTGLPKSPCEYPFDLSTFEGGLTELLSAVENERRTLRFEPYRKACHEATSLIDARPPDAPQPWQRHVNAVESDPQAMQEALDQIRSSPMVSETILRPFLELAFAHPEQTAEDACRKAVAFRDLGNKCLELGSQAAFDFGIQCLDEGLRVSLAAEQRCGLDAVRELLADLYENRARASQKQGAFIAETSTEQLGDRKNRAKNDAALRDLLKAQTLRGPVSFSETSSDIAKVSGSRSYQAAPAYSFLTKVCSERPDFPDAHFLRFLHAHEAKGLDKAKAWDAGKGTYRRLTPEESRAKIASIESATAAFSIAEFTAQHHHALFTNSAPIYSDQVIRRLGLENYERLTELHKTAAQIYTQAGSRQDLACAVMHLAKSIAATTKMMAGLERKLFIPTGKTQNIEKKEERKKRETDHIKTQMRRLETSLSRLHLQKSALYDKLELWSCLAGETHQALKLAHRRPGAAGSAKLRLNLGKAYFRLGKMTLAKEQLTAACKATDSTRLIRLKTEKLLREITSQKATACQEGDDSEARGLAAELPVLTAFRQDRLLEECLQILADNETACGSTQGWVWSQFSSRLLAASNIKEWVEVVIAHVRLSSHSSPERVLRLVELSNLEHSFADPTVFDELFGFLGEALSEFIEQRTRAQDECLRAQERVQAELARDAAFQSAMKTFAAHLLDGNGLRPNSQTRQDIAALHLTLCGVDKEDVETILSSLEKVLIDLNEDTKNFIRTHPEAACQELKRLLEVALTTNICVSTEACPAAPGKPSPGNVVRVTGQTFFLSQCLDQVCALVQPTAGVCEVRIQAERLYIDQSIELPGINLSLGAQHVEWLQAVRSDGTHSRLRIDLSGAKGDDAAATFDNPKAANGATYGADGAKGVDGAHGQGGQAGGDLHIHAARDCRGFSPENIEAILLNGGLGGDGGNGQAGGNAAVGQDGHSAEENEANRGFWKKFGGFFAGYDYHLKGSDGGGPGQAGLGGLPGLGSAGGAPGRFIPTGVATEATGEHAQAEWIQRQCGANGSDGTGGLGGEGATAGADGLDIAMFCKGWFSKKHKMHGYGLHCTGRDRRQTYNWKSTWPTREDNMRRHVSKDLSGQRAGLPTLPRNHRTKVDLDASGNAAQTETRLAQHASENQHDLFSGVREGSVAAEAAAARLASQGAEHASVLSEAAALQETFASQLHSRQAQSQATAQRGARGPLSAPVTSAQRVHIAYDGQSVPETPKALLSLALSPIPHPRGQPLVVHPIELAIDAVNASYGSKPEAFVQLMQALGAHLRGNPVLPKPEAAEALLKAMASAVTELSAVSLIHDPSMLISSFEWLGRQIQEGQSYLEPTLSSLGDMLYRLASMAVVARELRSRAQDAADEKAAQVLRSLKVRQSLCRAIAADRLMYRLLLSDADLERTAPLDARSENWLSERLRQQISRVDLEQKCTQSDRDSFVQWAQAEIASLRGQVRQNRPTCPRDLSEMVKAWHGACRAAMGGEAAELNEHRRQIALRLDAHCAELAEAEQGHPAELETMDIKQLAHQLSLCPAGKPWAPSDDSEEEPNLGQSQSSLQTFCQLRNTLFCKLAAIRPKGRLHTHLERQLETLRQHFGNDSKAFPANIASVMEQIYTTEADVLPDELLPMMGEVIVALHISPKEVVSNVYEVLWQAASEATGESLPPPKPLSHAEMADCLIKILMDDQLTDVQAISLRRLLAWEDGAGEEMSSLGDVVLDFLNARMSEIASSLLTQRLSESGSQETSQILGEKNRWMAQTARWLTFADLIPETPVYFHLIAAAGTEAEPCRQTEDAFRSFFAAILPQTKELTPNSPPDQNLLEIFEKEAEGCRKEELSYAARAALFLLITGEPDRAISKRLLETMRKHLPQDDESNCGGIGSAPTSAKAHSQVSALYFAQADLTHRLWDELADLQDKWGQASQALEIKLHLVAANERLRKQIPFAQIQHTLRLVKLSQPHLTTQEQVDLLEKACQAVSGRFDQMAQPVNELKRDIVAQLGRLDPSDGWDASLAEIYNNALATVQTPDELNLSEQVRANAIGEPDQGELLMRLVAGLQIPLSDGADTTRMARGLSIGLQELSISKKQQIEVYRHLLSHRDAIDGTDSILEGLQAKWLGQLQKLDAELAANHTAARTLIDDARHSLIGKCADLTTSLSLTNAGERVADVEAFAYLLDVHYIKSAADHDGHVRKAVLEQTFQDIEKLLNFSVDARAEFDQLQGMLRAKLCEHVCPDQKDRQLEHLHQLLNALTSQNGRALDDDRTQEVIDKLQSLLWRGLLPFRGEDEADSALTRLNNAVKHVAPDHPLSPEGDPNYDKLLRCLNVKFATHLGRDDAFLAQESVGAKLAQEQSSRGDGLQKLFSCLNTAYLEPSDLDAVPALEEKLKELHRNPLQWSHGGSSSSERKQIGTSHTASQLQDEAFGPWLADVLAHPEKMTERSGAAEVIAGLKSYIEWLGNEVKDDAQLPRGRQSSLRARGDDVCLASVYRLLGTLSTRPDAGEAAQLVGIDLVLLQQEVERLQHHCIEQQATSAKRANAHIEAVVAKSLEHLAQSHPVKTNLTAILKWPQPPGRNCREFLSTHSAVDTKATLRQVIALKQALKAACAVMGDEAFVAAAEHVKELTRTTSTWLSLENLTELWLALPNSADANDMQAVLASNLPDSWAAALRERQATQAMSQLLGRSLEAAMQGPLPSSLNVSDIDRFYHNLVKKESDVYAAGMKWWTGWLSTFRKQAQLSSDQRAFLIGLVARKLKYYISTESSFSLSAFQSFARDLGDEDVLVSLRKELSQDQSLVAQGLQSASLDDSRQVLTQTWIVAKLKGPMTQLKLADRNRLVTSLIALSSKCQQQSMRDLVQALSDGGSINTAAVDAACGFVAGSYEFDEQALELLRGRNEQPSWLADLSCHTELMRSRMRGPADLALIMANEVEGINRAVGDWVCTGTDNSPSRLETSTAAIRSALERGVPENSKPIRDWSTDDIKAWAEHETAGPEGKGYHLTNKGPQLWQSEERVHTTLAVFCQAVKLARSYSPRDTQLAAILLLTRHGDAAESHGQVGQVSTGEGKSIITAGISVLKAMSGLCVDVITTSKVLAIRDAHEAASIYAMFGLKVANNCDQSCESGEGGQSAETIRRSRYSTHGIPTSIVYGDAGAFERDQLLTSFHPNEENKQVIDPSRQTMARRCAIIDEVDGLLLDDASMVLYLSHEMQSLQPFEHIFVRIWNLVNTLDPRALHGDNDDAIIEQIAKAVQEQIKDKELSLPKFSASQAPYMEINNIATRRLSGWVRSALQATRLKLDQEYVIEGCKNPSVIVVDKGTGVEQAALKWSHGLHQFLQLKHGLEVSPESLKAVYLSNRFFFKQYGHRLVGMTGTLGSEAERAALTELYGVDSLKLPRAYGEKYTQKAPVVAGDPNAWVDAIRAEVAAQKESGRATLVVCNTIDDVMSLSEHLKSIAPDLHAYTSANQELAFLAPEEPREVSAGDVIIATNLAGRGTDFKTSKALEQAGGLHVVLSFMPPNIRIEIQGFGRTARGQNNGSGQFIICDPRRRPLEDIRQERDLLERQRLEKVLQHDVKRIDCEHDFLMGYEAYGERVRGFASLLAEATKQLEASGNTDYYVQAQLTSLKNRWACWLDSVDSKLDLVHILGRRALVESYRIFEKSVFDDLARGWEGFIVEPSEWLKLGSAYRRDTRFLQAERCYAKAEEDPDYAIAGYLKMACRFHYSPTSCSTEKLKFKKSAKVAMLDLERKYRVLQQSEQMVSALATKRRANGNRSYGERYKNKATDTLKIYGIFLSSFRDLIGSDITLQCLKEAPDVCNDEAARHIITELVKGGLCKSDRVSKKLTIEGERVFQDKQEIRGLHRFIPILKQLDEALIRGQPFKVSSLSTATENLVTRNKALALLGNRVRPSTHLRLGDVPEAWAAWNGTNFSPATRAAISRRYEQFTKETQVNESLQRFTNRFTSTSATDTDFSQEDLRRFLNLAEKDHIIKEDVHLDFAPSIEQPDTSVLSFSEAGKKLDACTGPLDSSVADALHKAMIELHPPGLDEADTDSIKPRFPSFKFKTAIYLSELPLFSSAKDAADCLEAMLRQAGSIKNPKVKLPTDKSLEEQLGRIKHILRHRCHLEKEPERITLPSGQVIFAHKATDEAVDAVFNIIQPTVSMLRRLDATKSTVQFAEIMRASFLDNGIGVPPSLYEFIEAGLDVVASLIEKKDPPSWWELAAVFAMGLAQVIGGTLIKFCLPIAGELVGNFLTSTGLDDIVFGVSAAVGGEFSWGDYWRAKQASMISAAKSAILVSVSSFAVSSAKQGASSAWRAQKLSHAYKLKTVGAVAGPGSFNASAHIAKEAGRAMASSGLSQLAGRGIQSLVSEVAGNFSGSIAGSVKDAVNKRWNEVAEQIRALHTKLDGNSITEGIVNRCIQKTLDSAKKKQAFTSITRTSKPAISTAASSVANGGWAVLGAAVPDLANLGVSIYRMATLVESEVSKLARTIRDTTDRREESGDDSITEESLEIFIGQRKDAFGNGLVEALNNLLESSVYSPFVSYTTQFATDKVVRSLFKPTEVEQWATDNEKVLEALDRQEDSSTAFYDDILMKWRGVETQFDFDKLGTEEQISALETKVEGMGKSLGDVFNDYRLSALEIFRDNSGRLYVQRPQYDDYVSGVPDDKPAGPTEFLAAAVRYKRPVSIRDTSTNIVKTYYPDGRIDGETAAQAIKLDLQPGENGALHHITAANMPESTSRSNRDSDCFYEALIQVVALSGTTTVATERQNIADCMKESDVCRIFFHNDSLKGDIKSFAGETNIRQKLRDAADWYDNLADEAAYNIKAPDFDGNVVRKYGSLAAIELGRGYADLLRLGEGIESGSVGGVGRDALRLGVIAVTGPVSGMAVRGASLAVRAGARHASTVGRFASARFTTIANRYRPLRAAQQIKNIEQSINQVIGRAVRAPGRRGGDNVVYRTTGGFRRASEDFDKITKGLKIERREGGLRYAELPDRRTVIVRPFSGKSRNGPPTLEIQNQSLPKTKVRYDLSNRE